MTCVLVGLYQIPHHEGLRVGNQCNNAEEYTALAGCMHAEHAGSIMHCTLALFLTLYICYTNAEAIYGIKMAVTAMHRT